MIGYYITYGIFTNELDDIIKELENNLEISLTKSEYEDELYCLSGENSSKIVHFTISNSSVQYHLNECETVCPKYLISCNVILPLKDEEYISRLRMQLNKILNIKELNFDTDEW